MNIQHPTSPLRQPVALLRLSLTRARGIGICPDAANNNGRPWPQLGDERHPLEHG